MIKFFVGIFSFLMVILGIIFVSCAIMLALACLDFLCDTDIKGQLVRDLGDRHLLKDIRKNVVNLFDKYDTPSEEDYQAGSLEQYKRYIHLEHVRMLNAKEETDS